MAGNTTRSETISRRPAALLSDRAPRTSTHDGSRHGGSALTAHPSTIEVAVEDRSPEHPRPRTPNLQYGTGGFGWHMVNDLAHTTITPTPEGGKTIRVLLPR
ncbi:hypothetical protein [Streptomyces sp. NBC_00388]|uniref:hypothetical protein n=1 Tax=Streptomyces sp. NBC_00388 TaxID=2975735 RepID=UPI002E20AC67